MSEESYQRAFRAYNAAKDLHVHELVLHISDTVREVYPNATSIEVVGEYRDTDGAFIVRLRQVLRGDGLSIGNRTSPNEDLVATLEGLSDEVDPELDYLGELTGEDYLGYHQITLATEEIPPLVVLGIGTPADGFDFVGPAIPNSAQLDRHVDTLSNTYWWYAPLAPLPS